MKYVPKSRVYKSTFKFEPVKYTEGTHLSVPSTSMSRVKEKRG